MASVIIDWAYHVTNVPESEEKPDWTFLRAHPGEHIRYDGPLRDLKRSYVYFSTTKMKGDLPHESPYPTLGIKGSYYWRVRIPTDAFSSYSKFWFCDNIGEPQIRLILTKNDKEEIMVKHPGVHQINVENNPYLCRRNEHWYSNDWNDARTKFSTNFVILSGFELPNDCIWDTVQRSFDGPGFPYERPKTTRKL